MTTLRLTYAQLAERTRLTPEGARMLARRRHWHIVKGNDGKAVVVVDEADLVARPAGRSGGRPPGQPSDMTGLEQELRARIAELQDVADQRAAELLAMTARAAGAEGEARALRDALADLAGRLDRAEAELRRPWWRRLFGMLLVATILPALASCSPEARQAASGAALDMAISDLGTAAGLALHDMLA